MAHTFNLGTWEAEAGEETMSQKKKTKKIDL